MAVEPKKKRRVMPSGLEAKRTTMAKDKQLDSDRRPWEKQTWETAHQYTLFGMYRDLGSGRSLLDVIAALKETKKVSKTYIILLRKYSARNLWAMRASAYDEWTDSRIMTTVSHNYIEGKADVLRRHGLIGRELINRAVAYLTDNPIQSTKEAIAALKLGWEIESKSIGIEDLARQLEGMRNITDEELIQIYHRYRESLISSGNGTEAPQPETGQAEA